MLFCKVVDTIRAESKSRNEEGKRKQKVTKVMREFKSGTLHSGKGGKVVKSRKQAIAIALSEAKMAKKKGKK